MINIKLPVWLLAYTLTFIQRKHLKKYLGLRDRLKAAIAGKSNELDAEMGFDIKPEQIPQLAEDLGQESEGNTSKIHGTMDKLIEPQLQKYCDDAMVHVAAWQAYAQAAAAYQQYQAQLDNYNNYLLAIAAYNANPIEGTQPTLVTAPEPVPAPILPTIAQPTELQIATLKAGQAMQVRTEGQKAYKQAMIDEAFQVIQ